MLLKKNIPFQYVFGKIKYEILAITLYAALIASVYYVYPSVRITIPLAIPAVLGTVISLLLGFRSNQAYDRWWEARHIWGAIVNESRTLARQLVSFTHRGYGTGEVGRFTQRMINRQIAWCYSTGQHLRGENPMSGMEKYIDAAELKRIGTVDNVPTALMNEMGHEIHHALEKGWINSYQQVELDRTLTRLCDALGRSERIKNTVFPSTYSLYIHLSLLLFIGLLPFAVIEYFGFVEVPLVVAISACFLLIEKMAIHLQDPFDKKPTDTPVTHIAQGIEKNLTQLYIQPGQKEIKRVAGSDEPALADTIGRPESKKRVADDHLVSFWKGSAEKKYFIM